MAEPGDSTEINPALLVLMRHAWRSAMELGHNHGALTAVTPSMIEQAASNKKEMGMEPS